MDTLLYGIGRYGKKSMRRGGDLNVAVHLSDGIVWYAGAEDPAVVDEVRALYPSVDFDMLARCQMILIELLQSS